MHARWDGRAEGPLLELRGGLHAHLTADPDEEGAARLYGVFDDDTISRICGVLLVRFQREATSLEAAIRSAIASIRSADLDVARVEIEPRDLAHTA